MSVFVFFFITETFYFNFSSVLFVFFFGYNFVMPIAEYYLSLISRTFIIGYAIIMNSVSYLSPYSSLSLFELYYLEQDEYNDGNASL